MGNGGKCNDRKLAPEAVKWQTIPCSAFFFVLHCSACHLFALHRGKQRECFDFLFFDSLGHLFLSFAASSSSFSWRASFSSCNYLGLNITHIDTKINIMNCIT